MPYGQQKAAMMADRSYPAGLPVELALKDVALAREAGASDVPTIEHIRRHPAPRGGRRPQPGRPRAVAEVTG